MFVNLASYSPTVSTQNVQVILQLASSLRVEGSCGDLKAAFMQSDPLKRERGELFVTPPPGGLPGLEEEQLVQIVSGVYGLIDAPLHWRRTLTTYLRDELKYQQSRLDPTIFFLHINGRLEGIIIIEIDDLLCFGYDRHDKQLSKLRERFKFGKFKKLQELADGTSFNGRRIQQDKDYNIRVDVSKFVKERLSEVHLEKGRKSTPDAEALPEEIKKVRAAIGSLSWCAKEGRPDASAGASILASKMTKMKIRDIVALNRVISQVRAKPDLTLIYHSIPYEDLRFGVVTDASWDNYSDGSSQGAVGVLAYRKSFQRDCQMLAAVVEK